MTPQPPPTTEALIQFCEEREHGERNRAAHFREKKCSGATARFEKALNIEWAETNEREAEMFAALAARLEQQQVEAKTHVHSWFPYEPGSSVGDESDYTERCSTCGAKRR